MIDIEKTTTTSPIFQTPFLNDYLAMVEDTESPRLFHVWSALFCLSASLGRRCYLTQGGIGALFPNLYVLLVGTPGTRKSTAAGIGRRLLANHTGVRFIPSDTGFQRQGVIQALQGESGDKKQEKAFVAGVEVAANSIASLTDLANADFQTQAVGDSGDGPDIDSADTNDEGIARPKRVQEDRHHALIYASEFTTVVGQGNSAMLDFLNVMYDGEDYSYQTLKTLIRLKDNLLGMMACTTPTSIATALPPQAGGQGILSRVILVYGAKKYKEVPRVKMPPRSIVDRVSGVFEKIFNEMQGAFSESAEAANLYDRLYSYKLEITDSRFGYYAERRGHHLRKIAMLLAAANGTMTIQASHYEEAHRILRATEIGMPDALGEFGMNPLAQLKQDILEHMRVSMAPFTTDQIMQIFHRDARAKDLVEVINDLIHAGLIGTYQAPSGQKLLTAKYNKQSTESSMMKTLVEKLT